MSVLWTADGAAAATGGRALGDWAARGVSIDTRPLVPGDLFVALAAVRDGHDFVAEALARGAAAALVARRPEGVAPDAPLLVVADVQRALEDLGRAGRARARARVVAVTGSAGKTSAKEMLRAALGAQGRVHAAEASYNNHWGVPLTLARLPQEADFAVIEIGMSHPGEIAPLARLARPHVALVTTVAPAHLAAFADLGGLEGIAREKGTICTGLEPGGVAVLNGDLPQSPILFAAARAAAARAIGFGAGAGNDFRLGDWRMAQGASVATAEAADGPFLVKVAAEGRHFLMNALGVLACVEALGADRARALIALADWAPPGGRGRRERVVIDPVIEGMTVDLIDDAFNANPASLSAALAVLAASSPANGVGHTARGRRIAILGDMLELGPDEAPLHRAVAADPSIAAVDLVHCVGPRMAHLWAALPEGRRGRQVGRAEDLLPGIGRIVDAGDVVMVKGSKGSRVSILVEAIRRLGQRGAGADVGAGAPAGEG
ncbi:MAG: UDP-N-acetylmuramoyl-tripeptide--D-alanyl-D-alanine ligase [Rubellimicrobium sp.]|nr:UDP-N-acetylmuramoyl-tripeptide--D-alanyl-D-alanine ligase [Rubellimicrobium sp.]